MKNHAARLAALELQRRRFYDDADPIYRAVSEGYGIPIEHIDRVVDLWCQVEGYKEKLTAEELADLAEIGEGADRLWLTYSELDNHVTDRTVKEGHSHGEH